MRRIVPLLLIIAVSVLASTEARSGENVWYSIAVPGWGQVRAGHYGRGALFLSGELVALTTLAIADIQYNRAVEQYDRAKASYLHATYIGDAVDEYALMHERWDSADNLYGIRQTTLYVAIGVWAINVVDMIIFDSKEEPPLSISARPGGFLVTGSISF
ncbi:MAG: DUF5683 domain-containing protein [Candidatus Krumholzibacteria bacterium]|nr:DUF5683 domain-containing protein [Candidatus Krumholzibacteria bacterium]